MNDIPSQQSAHNRAGMRETKNISIVDLQIPFGRMVAFMVKWAFAAIPALIIIWAVVLLVFLVVSVFFGGIAALIQHQH